MRCCGKLLGSFLVGLFLLIASSTTQAADISIRNPQLSAGDEGYVLSADFTINLNARLEEVVAKGVALYFVVDFIVNRRMWIQYLIGLNLIYSADANGVERSNPVRMLVSR